MYTKQQQLAYLKKLQHLQQFNVIKDDIHLTYKQRNKNKAVHKAHTLQDKIIDTVIDEAIFGNTSPVVVTPVVDELISEVMAKEQKRIPNVDKKYVGAVVDKHSTRYSEILNNRLNIEAAKLETKIESEIASGIHNDLSEEQLRKELKNKYGETGKKRIHNIIQDSIHSQECNISFINALYSDYRYKIWCNGNKRGNTRAWHIAKTIAPVPIDEMFEIHGPYGVKQSMFPGDLNSGAENVANCKCYLRYSNNKPSGLKQTVFNAPTGSYLNRDTKMLNVHVKEFTNNVKEKVSSAISTTMSKVKSTFNDVTSSIKSKFKFRK